MQFIKFDISLGTSFADFGAGYRHIYRLPDGRILHHEHLVDSDIDLLVISSPFQPRGGRLYHRRISIFDLHFDIEYSDFLSLYFEFSDARACVVATFTGDGRKKLGDMVFETGRVLFNGEPIGTSGAFVLYTKALALGLVG